jgi:hypothetical protein
MKRASWFEVKGGYTQVRLWKVKEGMRVSFNRVRRLAVAKP